MTIKSRPVAPGDTPAIAGLINAHSLAVVGARRALIDADGDLRTARYIPGAAGQQLVFSQQGDLVGHTWLISRPPHNVVEFGCTVQPAWQQSPAGDALLDALEAAARQSVALAPPGVRVVMQTTILADDAFMHHVLAARGFQPAREWVHLELALTETPAMVIPEGVTIRAMDQRVDWPAVGAVMDAAFADHWGEMRAELRTLLEEDEADEEEDDATDEEEELEDDPYSNSLGLCFVAEANGAVIGSCLCNARTVEWPDTGKLGSLSVLRHYRRTGVGRALTATALAEFHRRGVGRVITDTDNESFTGANHLYISFGFRPYRYEHVYEKEVRPGMEWRALTPDQLTSF
jgi:ribosomal protein S18 acetylase RimI-like enzyme